MNIKIDSEKCIGCGACVGVCSNGLEIINEKAVVKNNQADCFEEAVKTCPINIISIV